MRAQNIAAADLAAAERALACAEEEHRAAEAAVREAGRRISAAGDEALHAEDALSWARERGDEPAVLVGLDERLSAARRVQVHEEDALHGVQAALTTAARSRDHARNRVRQAQERLAQAEKTAQDPQFLDPGSPASGLALFFQDAARRAAPAMARLHR